MRTALTIAFLLALACAAAEFGGDTEKDRARVLARKTWWAFQPLKKVQPPKAGHPIDAFLPASSKPAVSRQRVRRLTLDLTGIPPAPQDVAAFTLDLKPGAYERLVDRLLASDAYGERWAQRWLDVVRYADTNGFELDADRPHAWRYRDYVVRSFNADKPFDRFLKEQVAGDEIWPADKDAIIALGFHRAGPEHLVGGNQDEEMNRQEVLTEMTAGISNVFLGLTMNCARCHNHKFDPILQSDYYRLQAVFGTTDGKEIPIADAAELAAYEMAKKAHAARVKPVQDAISAIEKPYKDRLIADRKAALAPELRALLDGPAESLTEAQKAERKNAKEQITPSWDEVLAQLTPQDREKRTALRQQLHAINLDQPQPATAAYAVVNGKPRDTHVLKIGDHKMKLGTVEPGIPVVLSAVLPSKIPAEPVGRRKALAEWLADPSHPLTARVMVNRIWQFRMGQGIVGTPNDFGTLGQRPTHPELLDWLAGEFIRSNWSVKHVDRLILTSAAYRQSKPLHRRRLEGEAIRDSVLAVSGSLNRKAGGPPVRVPIEQEVYDLIFTEYEADNLWPLPKDRSEIYRRSLYLLNKRTVRLPLFANFDQPDTMTSCAQRPVSTHALQSLSMLNSDFMTEQSSTLAARLRREAKSPVAQVRQAYQLAVARPPSPAEVALANKFFRNGGTLQDFCLALLNRSEFLYIP